GALRASSSNRQDVQVSHTWKLDHLDALPLPPKDARFPTSAGSIAFGIYGPSTHPSPRMQKIVIMIAFVPPSGTMNERSATPATWRTPHDRPSCMGHDHARLVRLPSSDVPRLHDPHP